MLCAAKKKLAAAEHAPTCVARRFFGYISGFLDMVKNSWNEIEGNPATWRLESEKSRVFHRPCDFKQRAERAAELAVPNRWFQPPGRQQKNGVDGWNRYSWHS